MMPNQAAPQAGPVDPLDRLGFVLSRHGKVMSRRIEHAMARLGLSQRHGAVLLHLGQRPVSQQSLVELLGIDPSQVVVLLNDLERARLALRRRDPDDRRRHIVELTARGRQTIEAVERAVALVEDELLADLDPDERELLRGLLKRVRISADDPPCGASSPGCG